MAEATNGNDAEMRAYNAYIQALKDGEDLQQKLDFKAQVRSVLELVDGLSSLFFV
jgi:hypothetical protein